MLPADMRGGDGSTVNESLVSPRTTTGSASAVSSSSSVTTWVMWGALVLFGLSLGALVGLTLTHIFNGIPAQHHISADDADAIDALINQGPHHVVETIGRPADSPGEIMVNDTMNVGGVLYADAVFVVDTLTPTRAVNPLINVLRYIDRQILAHIPLTTCCTEFGALVTRVEDVEGDITLLSADVAGALVDVADVLADVAVLTVRVDGHDAALLVIDGQVFLLQATDAAQQVEIDALRVDVDALAALANATTGAGNVTVLVGRVENNTLAIAALEIRVTANEACCTTNAADISALGIQVTTIEGDIVWVWGNLTALGLQVATNTAGVATNTAGIAGLISNVTVLDGRVNANEACCITNAADVAAVVTRVDQHDVQFVWVHNNITAQGVLIAVSIADIAQLQLDFATLAAQLNATASFGNITMLTMQVQNNTLVIAAFEIRITANEACCTTNAADVAAVVARVDDHDVQIVWIWGNLTAQGLQTANNTAGIASLFVDLAALVLRVTTTEANIATNTGDIVVLNSNVTAHSARLDQVDAGQIVQDMRIDDANATAVALAAAAATNAAGVATNAGDIVVLNSNVTDHNVRLNQLDAGQIIQDTRIDDANATAVAAAAAAATNAAGVATNAGDIVVLNSNVTDHNVRLNQLDAGQIVQDTRIDNANATAVAAAAAAAVNAGDIATIDATLDTTDLALLNTEQSTASTSALLRSMLTDIDSLGMAGSDVNCSTILVTNTDVAFGIAEALAEAASRSPSPVNPVAIELCAGIHMVDNSGGPLYVPNSVSIVAPANYMATIIVPADATKSVFRIAGGNRQLRGFTINAPTATTFGVVEEGDGTVGITTFTELYYIGHGLLQTNTTSNIAILMRSVIIRLMSETSVGVHIQNTGSDFAHYATTIGVLSDSSVVNEIATVAFKYEIAAPLTATIVLDGGNFKRVGTAIYLDVEGVVEMDNLSAADVDESIIHIENPAVTVYSSGVLKVDLDGDALSDASFLTGNSSAHVHLFGDQTEYTCQEANNVPSRVGVYVDTNVAEGDVLRSMTDVAIGMPEQPYSLHAGDGKHTFRNLLIYTSIAGGALSPAFIGNCYGNDTVDLNILLNSAIYLAVDVQERHTGDMFQHYGLYLTVETAAVYGLLGSIVPEYYDGTTWRAFATMSFLDQSGFPSDANTPFVSTGNQYVNYNPHIATDHLAYPESGGTTYGAWAKNDPIASGMDRYWVRFRVAGALTTGPQLSYVAYTGNGHEWGINGEHLYHGKARKYRKVPTATGDMGGANIGSDPGEIDVYHSTLEFSLNNNLLEDDTDSNRLHWVLLMPGDVDTSAPIRMTIYHSTTGTATGNVALEFAWASAAQGDGIYDNSGQALLDLNPNERSDTIIRTISDTEQLSSQSFLFDIPEYAPIGSTNAGSLVMVRMNRLGAAIADTFNNDIIIVGVNFEYVQRMDGVPFYEFV